MFDVCRDGSRRRILWGADPNARYHAREYLEGLDAPGRAKFEALFRLMAETGYIRGKERFTEEVEGIYCFNSRSGRITCFLDGRDVVLLRGFDAEDERHGEEVAAAEALRRHLLKRTKEV